MGEVWLSWYGLGRQGKSEGRRVGATLGHQLCGELSACSRQALVRRSADYRRVYYRGTVECDRQVLSLGGSFAIAWRASRKCLACDRQVSAVFLFAGFLSSLRRESALREGNFNGGREPTDHNHF